MLRRITSKNNGDFYCLNCPHPFRTKIKLKSHPENSVTAKVSEHIPSGFSMSTILSFKSIENEHDVYRGKDCMKKVLRILKRARNEDN